MTQPSRIIDQPREGLFKLRLVKGGPFVAARIWIAKDGALLAHANGMPTALDRVWLFGKEIEAPEYKRLMASTLVASEACDLRSMPSPF